MSDVHQMSDPVSLEALKTNAAPVVALESTIITHGMPWPQNLEVARMVEADVRVAGADACDHRRARRHTACRPWTLTVELDRAGQARDVAKAEPGGSCRLHGPRRHRRHNGRRNDDRRPSGGDRRLCHWAVSAGCTSGAEQSFDISADLEELAQTPVTVVASRRQSDSRHAQNARSA